MAGTRSSARLAANPASSPPSKNENAAKRKADASPASTKSKRGKKQQTLEQTGVETEETRDEAQKNDTELTKDESQPEAKQDTEPGANQQADRDTEMTGSKDQKPANGPTFNPGESFKGENRHGESKEDPEKALKDSRGGAGLNALEGATSKKHEDLNAQDVLKDKTADIPRDDVHAHEHNKPADTRDQMQPANGEAAPKTEDKVGGAVEHDEARAKAEPQNVLEKGLIYFFTRGRVGVEDMEGVQDMQRSYMVLRPLPEGSKLGDGKVDDLKNNRLIALPKKVWPKSPADKFMAFVEKAQTTIQDLKENFFQGSEYSTQTTGVRQTPPVTPIGEGVYAITSTGGRGEAHLAYMLTIPQQPGDLQSDVGIATQGSFLMSLKNPTVKGPAYASLPQKPDFPSEFIDEFHGRSWMPAQPKHLEYPNSQILLIGESIDGSALEPTKSDEQSSQKETPREEMEKLEHEDEIRIQHLSGDDTVFADLGISKKDYPDVATTW